ncbi:MAG TPA: DUF5302 domain-containing protein [Jatrophihabitans sp.]|jgi:hypothetical protein|nr:DUF5302 domain-containing protein [Jatrophihabitans sp.]
MAAADEPRPHPYASAELATATDATEQAPAEPADEPADDPADEPAREPADAKARFRDALERKKGRHADGVGGTGPSSGKISDVHSRAGGKRQFRRKSGG